MKIIKKYLSIKRFNFIYILFLTILSSLFNFKVGSLGAKPNALNCLVSILYLCLWEYYSYKVAQSSKNISNLLFHFILTVVNCFIIIIGNVSITNSSLIIYISFIYNIFPLYGLKFLINSNSNILFALLALSTFSLFILNGYYIGVFYKK